MKGRKTLEINPEHPIVKALKDKVDGDAAGAKVRVHCPDVSPHQLMCCQELGRYPVKGRSTLLLRARHVAAYGEELRLHGRRGSPSSVPLQVAGALYTPMACLVSK